MTYGNNANGASDTGNQTGNTSLLSFLRGRKGNLRSAGISTQVVQDSLTPEKSCDSDLQPELSSGSRKFESVLSGRCVATVLQVLAAPQDNLAALTGQLSPTASREGSFFSRTNSTTAPQGSSAAPGAAAAARDRSSLLSRLLKVRSITDSRPLSSLDLAAEGNLPQASPSSSTADAGAVLATAVEASAGNSSPTALSSSSSNSMLQLQSTLDRKRSRFGQQGAQFLSWSVDTASLPSLIKASQGEPSSPRKQQQQHHHHQQMREAQLQQSAESPNTTPASQDLPGAECYVVAKAAADAPASTEPQDKSRPSKSSLNSPRWRHGPWSPHKSPRPKQHQELDHFPIPSKRSPRKSAVPTVPVHELAAAFERRCAANSPPPPAASSPSPSSQKHHSPRRCKTPEGTISATAGVSSPRVSHFNAQQRQPPQQQQQQQQQHGGGSSSSRSSAASKPNSPFYTLVGQKQALSAWEGTPQQQQGTAAAPEKNRSRVPPLVWPPKVSAAVNNAMASSSSAPISWDPSQQPLTAQSSQQQQQQHDGIAAAAADSTSGSVRSTAESSSSTCSRGSSPFKPKPPANGASPQRLRPGMTLRQTFSAPQPASPRANTPQQASDSLPEGPEGRNRAAAAAAAATNAPEAAAGGPGANSAPAAAGGGGGGGGSASKLGTPRGLKAMPLMPLPRNKPHPAPSGPEIVSSPRAATDLEGSSSARSPTHNTPRSSPALISTLDTSMRLTPRVGTPRSRNSKPSSSTTHSSSFTAAGQGSPSQQQLPPAAAAAAAAAAASAAACAAANAQQVAEMQALQALQEQQQQVQAMQLKMQQSQPQLPVRAQASTQQPPQQQCMPIAIARHCPQDLQGPTWQPRDFIQTKKLYEGKIAAVVQGYHAASGRPLALKVYNRARLDTMERFQLAREVCLHMRSCHPSITALYAAYKDARYIYLLMELAPSGNLYQMLMSMPVPPGRPRCLPERDAVVRVIKPLLSALGYLHEQGIIHRDIKLENVLLTAEGTIKLADFGLSIDTRHEPANTRLGTQGYFAPEVLALPLKSSPFEGKSPEEAASRPSYDCKVDVWSAGVVCFEVLTGRAPFAAENVAQVLQAILHRQLVYPGHLSKDAVSFLSTALTRDPMARPTVRELLQHPFILMHTAQQQQPQPQQ